MTYGIEIHTHDKSNQTRIYQHNLSQYEQATRRRIIRQMVYILRRKKLTFHIQGYTQTKEQAHPDIYNNFETFIHHTIERKFIK